MLSYYCTYQRVTLCSLIKGASTHINSYFGTYNNRPMLLSSVGCYSSSVSLVDCSFSKPSSSCDQDDIAGVACEGKIEVIENKH